MVGPMHAFAQLLSQRRPLLILAPLASLSHRAMRELIIEQNGCNLFFTEMISAEALVHGSSYREWYIDAAPLAERVIFQLVGSDHQVILSAVDFLLEHFSRLESAGGGEAWAGIDINMGCSAPEMVRKGAGVHWMSQAESAWRLIEAIRPKIDSQHSLSVKMRIGEHEDFEQLRIFAQGLATAGCDFLTLHPRLRGDPWGRPARQAWFGRLAAELPIPLIANGDIRNRESLLALGDSWQANGSGQDWPAGIMVGRAAIRAPWIFKRFKEIIDEKQLEPNPARDLLAVALRFHELLELHQPADFWLTRAKRFYAYFCQNLQFGHRIASTIQNVASYPATSKLFSDYLSEQSSERFFSEP